MIRFSYHIKKDSPVDKSIQLIINLLISIIRSVVTFRKINSQRTLVVSLHKLGDTVFTIPAIKVLRMKIGEDLTIACFNDSQKIYELVFNDMDYITLNEKDFSFNGRIANSFSRRKLRRYCAGTVIDLTGGIVSASLLFDNRAKQIMGFTDGSFKKIYSDYIPKRQIPHLMDMYLDVVKLLIKVENDNELKYFGKSINREGYILIHPFAGWKAKEWEFNKFMELYSLISNSYKCKLIIPGNRIDDEILTMLKSKDISVIISDEISGLIDAVKSSLMVIGCDSGAVYIAALLGKPTFTIYGPTNPRFSLPFGEHHEYIYKETEYSPKYNEQYGSADAGRKNNLIDFMNSLTVEEVLNRINLFYKKIIKD